MNWFEIHFIAMAIYAGSMDRLSHVFSELNQEAWALHLSFMMIRDHHKFIFNIITVININQEPSTSNCQSSDLLSF